MPVANSAHANAIHTHKGIAGFIVVLFTVIAGVGDAAWLGFGVGVAVTVGVGVGLGVGVAFLGFF